jgi:hypothetical protein
MLHICKGYARKRLTLLCSRFYSAQELFKLAREQGRNTVLFLEFGPNLYHPIHTDTELRFVCSMMEGEIEASFPDDERRMNVEQVADMAHTEAFEQAMFRGTRKRSQRPKDPDRRKTLHKGVGDAADLADGVGAAHNASLDGTYACVSAAPAHGDTTSAAAAAAEAAPYEHDAPLPHATATGART